MADRDENPQTRQTGQRNKKTVAFSEFAQSEEITDQEQYPGSIPSELYAGHRGGPPVSDTDD